MAVDEARDQDTAFAVEDASVARAGSDLSPSITTKVESPIRVPSKTRTLARSVLELSADMCDPGGINGPRTLSMGPDISAKAACFGVAA